MKPASQSVATSGQLVAFQRHMHRRASKAACGYGFSLLEVVLSLSLSVFLLAAVGAAIDQSWRMSAQGQTEMQRQQVARAVLRILERDLRSVMFVPPSEFADQDDSTGTSAGSTSGSTNSAASGASTGSGSPPSSGTSSGSTTSTSTTTMMSATETTLVLASRGIRGTQKVLEIDGARPQRELAFALPVNPAIPSGHTSDLRTMLYALAAPGQAYDPQGRGGLAREEGDRYAIASAEGRGQNATASFSAVVLAPEVTGLEFEYFDGAMWQATWDSIAYGRLPRAVQVRIWFAPAPVRPTWLNPRVNPATEMVRLVVYIPSADPVPEEVTQ
jgi:type II secretory pathway component PulJ